MPQAIIIQPNGTVTVEEVADESKAINAVVGGYFEIIPLGRSHHAYVNEEGKLRGLPINMKATRLANKLGRCIGDYIVGPMIIFGTKGSGAKDVLPEMIETAKGA